MKPTKVILVNAKKVSCDGLENSSSHPLVYLNMGDKDEIICPYCNCAFKLKTATTRKSSN